MFDIDPTALALNVVFGGIGFIAYRYGRSMELVPPVVIGLTLMLYSWFVPNLVLNALIGCGLTVALWVLRE